MARVANRKFWDPPSGLNPAATAIASMRVDLPVPFSPTKNVTPDATASPPDRSRQATAGKVNG